MRREFDRDAVSRLASRIILEELEERNVEAVALAFVDSAGIARMKCVPITRLERVAKFGVGFSVVFTGAQADDAFAPVPGITGPTGDLRLVPDLGAAAVLDCSPGWAWAPVDQCDQSGHVWPGCQRDFLRRMVDQARKQDVELQAGLELEWVVARETEGELQPIHVGPGYGAATFGLIEAHMMAILRSTAAADIAVQQIHPEYGLGQVELSIAPAEPVRACDQSVLARHIIRTVAAQSGWRASFSPAVIIGSVGNGAHPHFSLWRQGMNLFHGGGEAEGLTADGASFVAGVLDHLDALTALGAPSPASALRLKPSAWAGAYCCWGSENREAALRLAAAEGPNAKQTANFEWKSVDGAANPYLVLGGIIAAGLDGLERRLELPRPVVHDPAALSQEARTEKGITRLPETLSQSADALESSVVLREKMGGVLHGSVVAVRRGEAAASEGLSDDELVSRHRWRY